MTYWSEYGRSDAVNWLRASRKHGLHPLTRAYFVRQALRCYALYKRDIVVVNHG